KSAQVGEMAVAFNPQSLRFIGGYLYSTLRVVRIGEGAGWFLLRTLRALRALTTLRRGAMLF
ncbi:MAG: hypothetical protein LBS54_05530, partial [Dysgonamonadaceae bacterium]|nr:hypothetical protein [Dysgonamonadaceae bacterium]